MPELFPSPDGHSCGASVELFKRSHRIRAVYLMPLGMDPAEEEKEQEQSYEDERTDVNLTWFFSFFLSLVSVFPLVSPSAIIALPPRLPPHLIISVPPGVS